MADSRDPCICETTISVPWEKVEKERQILVANSQHGAKVPGFRRGRAPASVLARYYEREIRELLGGEFAEAEALRGLAARDIPVASLPEVLDVRYTEGQPLEIDVRCEQFAPFELGEYRDLEIPVADATVTEEDVEDRLRGLRYRYATYRNVDPRPARDGDFVVVKVQESDRAGEFDGEAEESSIEVGGDDTLPEYSAALRGMSPGETVDFTYDSAMGPPSDDEAPSKVYCRANVVQIQEEDLPALDDDFAKDVNEELESLDDLRSELRTEMERVATRFQRRGAFNQIGALLAFTHPMAVPSQHLARRVEEQLGDRRSTLTEEELEEYESAEADRIRSERVLDRIATVEGISVSDEEVRTWVNNLLASGEVDQETLEKAARNGAIDEWARQQLRLKVLEFVFEEARHLPLATDDEPADEADSAEDSTEE